MRKVLNGALVALLLVTLAACADRGHAGHLVGGLGVGGAGAHGGRQRREDGRGREKSCHAAERTNPAVNLM